MSQIKLTREIRFSEVDECEKCGSCIKHAYSDVAVQDVINTYGSQNIRKLSAKYLYSVYECCICNAVYYKNKRLV